MLRLTFSSILVIIAVASGCGSRDLDGAGTAQSSSAIVEGVDAPNRLLNVGTIAVKATESDVDWHWLGCSGTLVAPDVFLTAGHCLFEWQTWGFARFGVTFAPRVSLGTDPWNALVPPEATVYTGTPVVHPDFSWDLLGADYQTAMPPDFAVIVLDGRVTGVVPAAIAPVGFISRFDSLLERAEIGMAGYGVTSAAMLEGADPDWGTRRYTTTDLAAVYPGSFEVSMTPGAACMSDSGGPLFPVIREVGGRVPPPRNVALVLGMVRAPAADAPLCAGGTVNTRLDTELAHSFLDPFLRRGDHRHEGADRQ